MRNWKFWELTYVTLIPWINIDSNHAQDDDFNQDQDIFDLDADTEDGAVEEEQKIEDIPSKPQHIRK